MMSLNQNKLSDNLKIVQFDLLKLYIADMIIQHGEILLLSNYLNSDQIISIKSYIPQLIEQIRPHALMLTESFLYVDMLLHSKIALTNGKVYEELYEQASSSSLNQQTVSDGVIDYVKPLNHKLRVSAKI